MKKVTKGTFIIFTFLMILFRLIAAYKSPLSFDEILQYDTMTRFGLRELLVYLFQHDWQMPLNYILNFPFVKSGIQSTLWLRAPSLIFSLLSLFFFYLLCKKKMGETFAWAGVSLLSGSYLSLKYAYSMRPYALLIMLVCLSLLLLELIKDSMKRDVFRLSHYLCFGGTLVLLFFTHVYGVIASALFSLWLYFYWNQKFHLWKRFNWSHFFFLGVLFTLFGLGIFYAIANPLFPHPNHHFPHSLKILFAFLLIFGGGIVPLSTLLISFFEKLKRKKRELFLFEVSFALGIPILSLFISYFYYPIFEHHFFSVSLPFGILLFLLVLWERGESRYLIKTLLVVTLIDFFAFSFVVKEIGAFEKLLNVEELRKYHPQIEKKITLFCGNCPTFYFSDPEKHFCAGGWDLSLLPRKYNSKKAQFLVVFTENEKLCKKYIHSDWKRTSFSGLEVYEKP